MTERKKGLDVARGIGIFFIVWSHTMADGEPLRCFLFSFHVPLFFIISGYFFSNQKGKNIRRYLKWFSLYVTLSVLDIFVLLVFNPALFSQKTVVKGMLGMDSQLIFNSPKWFLLCLIELQILMTAVDKLKVQLQIIIVIVAVVLGGTIHGSWVLGLNLVFATFPFFYLGYLLRKQSMYEKVKEKISRPVCVISAIVMMLVTWGGSQVNGMVSVQKQQYGNYILFLVCALCGSMTVILTGMLLEQVSVLSFLGKNTMPIFLLHYYLVRGLAPTVVPRWFDTIVGQIAISVISIGAILVGDYIANRIKMKIVLRLKRS